MAKIFSVPARAVLSYGVNPLARFLLRIGVSPNAVTVAGTVGVVAGAVAFGARGHLITGALVVTAFALTDLLDGTMARMRGGTGRFGALLDSSMDRISDGAVFGVVVYYFARRDDPYGGIVAALLCLVLGQVVSYVKARAEGLGLNADVGIAERTERLLLVGIGGILTGAEVEWGLPAALWLLVLLSVVTILQRLLRAAASDRANIAAAAAAQPAASAPAGSGPTGSGPTGSGPTGSGPTVPGPAASGPTPIRPTDGTT